MITLGEIEVDANKLGKAKLLYDNAWNLMKVEKKPHIWTAYYQSVSIWCERAHIITQTNLLLFAIPFKPYREETAKNKWHTFMLKASCTRAPSL